MRCRSCRAAGDGDVSRRSDAGRTSPEQSSSTVGECPRGQWHTERFSRGEESCSLVPFCRGSDSVRTPSGCRLSPGGCPGTDATVNVKKCSICCCHRARGRTTESFRPLS